MHEDTLLYIVFVLSNLVDRLKCSCYLIVVLQMVVVVSNLECFLGDATLIDNFSNCKKILKSLIV